MIQTQSHRMTRNNWDITAISSVTFLYVWFSQVTKSFWENHSLGRNLIIQICGMILTLFPFESVPGHHGVLLPWLALNGPACRQETEPGSASWGSRVIGEREWAKNRAVYKGLHRIPFRFKLSRSLSGRTLASFSLESRALGCHSAVLLWRKSRCFPALHLKRRNAHYVG